MTCEKVSIEQEPIRTNYCAVVKLLLKVKEYHNTIFFMQETVLTAWSESATHLCCRNPTMSDGDNVGALLFN